MSMDLTPSLDMSPKEWARSVIDQLPEDIELGELIYQLYFRQHIAEGLRDIEAGNTVSQEEVEREMREWRRSAGRAAR
jgi:hypothetical protein